MSSSTEEQAKRIFEGDGDSLWVQEGRIDFPVVLGERPDTRDSSKLAAVVAFVVDFGGGSGDGFIQLKPLDKERTRRSVWWSSDEPIVFDFRASVKAKGIKAAWPRARSFVEQALDRVSFLAGAPARLLSYGMLYNETQLGQCRDGARATVDCSVGGTFTRSTEPIYNAHVLPHFRGLSDRAKRALRWFRKASLYENPEDRFTGFYIALEAISDDVKEPAERTHRCQRCGESTGIGRSHTEGIKHLLARHPELPANTFRFLSKMRARLLHGSGSPPSQETLTKLIEVVQRLAAEGIAVSLRAEPASIRLVSVAEPDIKPLAEFQFSAENNPHTRWGGSVRQTIALAASKPKPPAETKEEPGAAEKSP